MVITPRGKTLLIDAGGVLGATRSGFDTGEEVVSNYLWARGVSNLDAVALTHAHGDHIGGLPTVLKNFHPRELWLAPSPPTQALTDLITEANERHIAVLRRVAGDKFDFGGAHFDVLAPSSDAYLAPKRINDASMVLKIAFGNASALFEGDAIRPQFALISVGKFNRYGHPRAEVLRRWQTLGRALFAPTTKAQSAFIWTEKE